MHIGQPSHNKHPGICYWYCNGNYMISLQRKRKYTCVISYSFKYSYFMSVISVLSCKYYLQQFSALSSLQRKHLSFDQLMCIYLFSFICGFWKCMILPLMFILPVFIRYNTKGRTNFMSYSDTPFICI